MTQIVHTPNPLFPAKDRKQYFIQDDFVGQSVAAVLRGTGFSVQLITNSYVVFLNDQALKPEELDTRLVAGNDIISVKAVAHGGGNSNILSILLEIVVIIASIYFGPEVGAAFGLTGQVAAGVGGALIMVAGSLLINHFFGPAFPGQNSQSTAQTYQITGTSNQARVGQPMPIVYGTVLMAPDVGANPYVDYENGNDQYLYEIFNFGYSNLVITDLTIGSTPISDFENVTIQWSDPTTGALTLFPGNVNVTAGASLTNQGGPITRTTAVNCTSVGVDISATLFQQNNDGSISSQSVTIYPQYKLTTASEWSDLISLTPSAPANGQLYNFSGGDVYNYGGGNVWTLTNDTSTPYVETYTANLPAAGQYDIKLTRLTQDIDTTTTYADTTWTQLKSYQPDTADYTGQTRLAIKILASSQLNGTISQLQAMVSAKCPVYDYADTLTWSTTTTSNPAWWYLWFARGLFDENGVRILGAGLPDDQIDIAGIIEWAAWCDANDLTFNYVEGNQIVVSDELALIARVGRGTISWSKGVLGVIYDQEGLPVTQMFGMSNIKAGSFQRSWTSQNLAQQINVQFINPDLQWQQDEVSAIVPGVTAPEFSTTIFIPGITSKTQAAQEANLQAAAQTLFTGTTQWETDIEGLTCSKGDVITLSHDLSSWSISGRLAPGAGSTTKLYLDREITFTPETQPYVSVRHPDGSIETIEVVEGSGTTNVITLSTGLAINPYDDPDGLQPRDYIYQFDPAQTPGKLLKVTGVTPQGNGDNWVMITARDEVAAYYDAATNPDWVYNAPTLLNQNASSVSNITFSEHTSAATGEVTLSITWILTHAVGAKLQLQVGDGPWTDEGIIYGSQYVQTFVAPTTVNVKLTPVAVAEVQLVYTTVTASYKMIGLNVPPESIVALIPNVTGLQLVNDVTATTFNGADAKFLWRLSSTSAPEVGSEPQGGDSGVSNPYFRDYQVQILNPDNSIRRTDYTQNTNYTYTFEMNSEDGDGTPARAFTIEVTTRGQQNQLSEYPAFLSVSNPAPAVPTGITFTGGITWVDLSFDDPIDTDYAGCLLYGSTNEALSAGASPLLLDTKLTNQVRLPGLTAGDTYYFYLAPYDLFGKTGLNFSSQYTVATVLIGTIDLGPGSVTTTILANAAVETANIDPAAVTTACIAAAAVVTASLASLAVATGNIQSAAVTTSQVASATLTGSNIAATTIVAGNITSGTITTTQIASNTIVGSNIAGTTIAASKIIAGTLTTTQIASATIVAGNIASSTITTTQIASSTIVTGNIASATITGGNIASVTLTSGNIAANTITSGQIAANTIVAGNIATNTIVASNLAVLSGGGTSIDANGGTITFNNGTYQRVVGTGFGASSNLIDWYGTTRSLASCATSNALFYLDTAGNAYFDGNLAVGSVTTTEIDGGAVSGLADATQTSAYNFTATSSTAAYYDNTNCTVTFSLAYATTVYINAYNEVDLNDGVSWTLGNWSSGALSTNVISLGAGEVDAYGYIKVDSTYYTNTNGSFLVSLAAGSHTVKLAAYVDTTTAGTSCTSRTVNGQLVIQWTYR